MTTGYIICSNEGVTNEKIHSSKINSGELWMNLAAEALRLPVYKVAGVINPAPGGGASNPAPFTIFPYAAYLPLTTK